MSVDLKALRLAKWWAAAAVAWYVLRRSLSALEVWAALGCKALIWLGSGAILARLSYREHPVAAFALGAPDPRGLPRAVLVVAAYLLVVTGLGFAIGEPTRLIVPPAGMLAPVIANAFIEEAAFRGLLVLHLARHMRFASANLLGGLAFLCVHLPVFLASGDAVAILIMSASLLALALALGEATRATRSIWIAVAAHTVNNLLAG